MVVLFWMKLKKSKESLILKIRMKEENKKRRHLLEQVLSQCSKLCKEVEEDGSSDIFDRCCSGNAIYEWA